ncbi:hypothetical protein [Terasakiella sp. SH-1]|uniref:hypothetical protein n=1 Tax=Terasakiella sp. SH-1 TaxID=2560057 RepID=UPI00142F8DCD|nr:hypothetical protein [Terasakiella sp. SH-1]
MQAHTSPRSLTEKKDIPYSDFEVSISENPFTKEKREISRGRFLIWGDVKTNDCPA